MSKRVLGSHQQMIKEDLVSLQKYLPNSAAKKHIRDVLLASVDHYYAPKIPEIKTHKGRTQFSFTCDKIKKTLNKYMET